MNRESGVGRMYGVPSFEVDNYYAGTAGRRGALMYGGMDIHAAGKDNLRMVVLDQTLDAPRSQDAEAGEVTISAVIPDAQRGGQPAARLRADPDWRRRGHHRRRPLDRRHHRGGPGADAPSVRIVHQDGRGKGNALACGFAAARGRHHRDARRRRLDRPGRDPDVRRCAARRRRLRQGHRASPRAAAAPTSPRSAALGNRCLNGDRQRALGTSLHRPLLRLQRLLAPLPAGT